MVRPGTVAVAPPEVDVCDVLEYALAAIEQFGWRNTKQNGPVSWTGRGNPNKDQAATEGLSLHDAIGLACVELSQVYGEESVGKGTRSGSKDWSPTTTDAYGNETFQENLREQATAALFPGEIYPLEEGKDKTFNDAQDDEQPVLALLRDTINRVC